MTDKNRPQAPRLGDPRLPGRFWAKVYVRKDSDCWLWVAAKNRGGYGMFGKPEGGMGTAHRIAYRALVGEVPARLQLDHICRVRHCVNPAHLEPVAQRVNILRGEGPSAGNARKTHCPAGHPYFGDNLYVAPSGYRFCRTCVREHGRKYRTKRSAA